MVLDGAQESCLGCVSGLYAGFTWDRERIESRQNFRQNLRGVALGYMKSILTFKKGLGLPQIQVRY